MRVIAGEARSLKLECPDTDKIRPTQDRTKETLFNIIQTDVPYAVCLDLFAGTGALGIEALSRGARQAYFVDNSREAINTVNKNLKHTKLDSKATVYSADYSSVIKRLAKSDIKVDIIFVDPPYHEPDIYFKILNEISKSDILRRTGILVIESPLEIELDHRILNKMNMEIYKEKKYKTNKHTFLRKIDNEDSNISGEF